MKYTLTIPLLCLFYYSAQAQSSYDYEIETVRLLEVVHGTKERNEVRDLGAYMYDIGPAPKFEFEVNIKQLSNPTKLASHSEILVEQYILLTPKEQHAFNGLDSLFSDVGEASAFWVYHSPVTLSFSCRDEQTTVVCTSTPITPQFMDPEEALTYASPHAYSINGFAYRFVLTPSNIRVQDENMDNNAFQVTFLKR